MAQVIKPVRAKVSEDCLALGVPGSKEERQRVRKGSLVRITHEYKTAYYGRLEHDGAPVWLEKKVLNIQEPRAARVASEAVTESKHDDSDAPSSRQDAGSAASKAQQTAKTDTQALRLLPGFSADPETPAKALYSFDPASQKVPSGLALQAGDSLLVLGHDNAWFFGKNPRTGASGIFPKSFAQLETTQAANADHREKKKPAKQIKSFLPRSSRAQTSPERKHVKAEKAASPASAEPASERNVSSVGTRSPSPRRRRPSTSSSTSSLVSGTSTTATGRAAHRLSKDPALSEEALALVAQLRHEIPVTNELTKQVFDEIRKHCSRSFALLVLEELGRRDRARDKAAKSAAAAVREDADRDIRFLLEEVDKLTAERAPDAVAALRAELDAKSEQIAAYEHKVKDLQSKLAALENEEWLRNELAFLKQDASPKPQ